jgi:hypothetical protein
MILRFRARKFQHVKTCLVTTRTIVAACALLAAAQSASSADRWEEAGSGAVAILPSPKPSTGIEGGSFYCSQQSWAFLFRLTPEAGLVAGNIEKAKLAVVDQLFELDAQISKQAAKVSVPREILLGLKEGTGLTVDIGDGKDAPKATFNLRSSKLVIEAIAPRCSQIDMSAYESVSLSPTDPAVPQATAMLKDEIKLFREFTLKEPVVATTVLEFEGDKRLMLASLCGSNNYFGDSGCSLTGYAADGAESIWKQAYETEGVHIYIDRKQVTDGWPNLVTLPMVGGTEPAHWAWSGGDYQLLDQIISGETEVPEEGDTAAQ